MSKQKIEQGSEVTMHFSIHLKDGSVADSTKVNGKPGQVVIGDGTLTDAFEQEIQGLQAGDKKRFTLEAEDHIGPSNPESIKQVERSRFDEKLKLEKELIIEFTLPNGDAMPGIIRDFDDNEVTVDFNHPLAGQPISVDVEILEVVQVEKESN